VCTEVYRYALQVVDTPGIETSVGDGFDYTAYAAERWERYLKEKEIDVSQR
jgi:hypothetical protein